MPICFAFDNKQSQDGAGAQVFRIIGVYCLAKHYKLGFVNRRILTIESNPGDNMDSYQKEQELIADLEKVLNLESYSCNFHHEQRILPDYRIFKFDVFFLIWIKSRQLVSLIKKSHVVYNIANPYRLIMNNPDVYSNFQKTRAPLNIHGIRHKFDIQLHIRRAFVSSSIFQNRYSPTGWFREILIPITTLLRAREIPYEITVHTDVSHPNAVWKPRFSAGTLDYFKNNEVKFNEDSSISLNYENFTETLGDLGDINVVTGVNVLKAWEMMQSADLLLIGKSTFSFVPGLLNQVGTIISPIGFLQGPRSWIYLNEPPEMTLDLANSILDNWTTRKGK